MNKSLIFTAILMFFTMASACGAKSEKNSDIKQDTQMNNIQDFREIPGPVVLVSTTLGDIKIKLYDDTPLHRDNFLKLVKEGFYEGLLFHRVINNFMIQAGDPDSKDAQPGKMLGAGNPGYTVQAEIDYPNHYHKYGALAAARTGDAANPERRSSGSQFYIVTGQKVAPAQLEAIAQQAVMPERTKLFRQLASEYSDSIMNMQKAGDQEGLTRLQQQLIAKVETEIPSQPLDQKIANDYTTIGGTPHLDGQYTVFGEVIEGMDVVEKIQKVETDNNDRPREDVKILSVKILEE